jgi:hypothetical protein
MKEEMRERNEREFKKREKEWLNNTNIVKKKLLGKACCKYNNISDFEFCIGGKIPYIKVNFFDSRFNEFVIIMMID